MSQGAIIGERYRVLNELGAGGMGRVYRALDLVSGRVVAVKSVKTSLGYLDVPTRVERGGGGAPRPLADTGSNADDTVRAALAHEFEVLSNLRHENIVGVLDYGFDGLGQPYYAMELAEGARPLPDAAAGASVEEQAELMAQLLRGLDYLHWCGILHRDLKPSNVLVVDGKVKLLDFGIAVAVEHLDQERSGEFGGTLAYIAPEVLRGQPPSAASDLFGAGLVFFQMMTGHHPRSLASRQDLLRDILTKVVDGHIAGIPPELEPMLTRLLDPSPTDRYQDARAVLEDLAGAIAAAIPVETVATRNSFLSSAPLVGREAELTQLKAHARAALDGQGRAVLVGGPSGVGKSRLVEEMRISAQVRGALVLRGQAESGRALPYGLWTDIARRLCLLTEPDDIEAGVLAAIVPGVDALLGRAIPAPPSLDPAATQTRIALVVRSLLARLPRPAVLLVEDLHWATQESLRLLSAVASEVGERPILVVGTFRNDEAGGLPRELPDFRLVELSALGRAAVAEFVARVAGEAFPEARLDALMARTQGNPFFIVETLRTMAGQAGDLRQLGAAEIPESSAALQRLAQAQLRRVPPKHRPLLEVAAVAGRDVDLDLLQSLEPNFDFEGWVGTCTQASLFEFRAGALRFAHDKVREGILAYLAADRRSSVHRRIAEALESRATGEERLLPALAHHWGVAGEAGKERDYAVRAGRWALRSGACHEAVVYLRRALELPSPEAAPPAPAEPEVPEAGYTSREDLQVMLTEASFQLGRLEDVRRHGEAALTTLGYRIPSTGLGWNMGLLGELVTRFRQAMFRVPRVGPERRAAAYEALKVQQRLLELFVYAEQPVQLLWAGLRTINLGERLGDTPELARAYATMGVVMGSVPLPKVARAWGDRARALADAVDPEGATQIYVTVRRGVYGIGIGAFERVEAETTAGLELAERLRDQRGRDECRIVLSKCLHYASRFDEADEVAEALHASAIRRGDEQARGWGLLARTENAVRAGRHESVVSLFEELDDWVQARAANTEKVCPVGMMALARARSGDFDAALRLAERAEVLAKTTNVGVYWTLSGLAGAAEVFAEAAQRAGDRPSRTTLASLEALARALGKYARIFSIGRPAHLRAQGWVAWARGRRGPAREAWRRSAAAAEALGMAFEAGAAHADLARHADDDGERARAVEAARGPLERAAARFELARLESALR